MSNAVSIKTQFKHKQTLLDQFTKVGWNIVENDKCTLYGYDEKRHIVHQYVAKNPQAGGYDVGIDFDSEGCAEFMTDYYDQSVAKQLGKDLKTIKQGYALSEIKKFMYEEDLDYQVEELPNGELIVIAEK